MLLFFINCLAKFHIPILTFFLHLDATERETVKHFANLPPKLFKQLVKIYKIDFELFGFEIPKHSDYVHRYKANKRAAFDKI